MNKGNDEPHMQPLREPPTLQDYILYIAVGDNIYTPTDIQKEKGED